MPAATQKFKSSKLVLLVCFCSSNLVPFFLVFTTLTEVLLSGLAAAEFPQIKDFLAFVLKDYGNLLHLIIQFFNFYSLQPT